VLTSARVPSVAGGPADAPVWDDFFGGGAVVHQDAGEAGVRAAKAEALSPEAASLYARLRQWREKPSAAPTDPSALAVAIRAHPEEWLLQAELAEMTASSAAASAA
jgi:phenylalanine-4-hydroxylase